MRLHPKKEKDAPIRIGDDRRRTPVRLTTHRCAVMPAGAVGRVRCVSQRCAVFCHFTLSARETPRIFDPAAVRRVLDTEPE
jgi:hypothetical protein